MQMRGLVATAAKRDIFFGHSITLRPRTSACNGALCRSVFEESFTMQISVLRLALILGFMSLVSPFAIDLYLPAMPRMAIDLNTDEAAMQWTLAAYFLSFGVFQMLWGPYADQAGRKKPLYIGLGIFLIASIGSAMAQTVETLTIWRFVQGFGGSVLMVVPRAVVRDAYTGNEATKLMAMIMLVISISPMLAPLAGTGLIALGGWPLIFWVLAGGAVLAIVLMATALPETLPAERRVPVNLRSMRVGSRALVRDPVFMGLTFVGGFGMSSFFVFLSSASFVYQDQYGLTPTQFSLAFAMNAVGFFASSQLAASLGARFGATRLIRFAIFGFATVTVLLFLATLSGIAGLAMIIGGLVCANAFLGLVIPTAMVLALDDHGENAGLASSLGGTMQMVTGVVMIAVATPFFDGTATPMVGAIAFCGVTAAVLALLSLSARKTA